MITIHTCCCFNALTHWKTIATGVREFIPVESLNPTSRSACSAVAIYKQSVLVCRQPSLNATLIIGYSNVHLLVGHDNGFGCNLPRTYTAQIVCFPPAAQCIHVGPLQRAGFKAVYLIVQPAIERLYNAPNALKLYMHPVIWALWACAGAEIL